MIDTQSIESLIKTQIATLVENTVDNLMLDQDWLLKIEELTSQKLAGKIMASLNQIDINPLIVQQVDSCVDRWYDRLRNKFETAGIKDTASCMQLTVMDGAVVAEGQLASTELLVDKNAEVRGTLTVDKLVLTGDINVDNRSWSGLSSHIAKETLGMIGQSFKEELVKEILDGVKVGIDFDSVSIDGTPLIRAGQLSPKIHESSLSKVGVLESLTVSGQTNLYNTLHAINRRVGINTENPEMALGVWDEEVSLAMGKHSQNTAYIGTTRAQNLVLGVNKNAQITIDAEGLTTVKQLRVGQFRIGHATEVPGYSGNRGDMVFNSDPKPGQPFAWVCLGSYKWQPLKSA